MAIAETVIVIACDAATRRQLLDLLAGAGYTVLTFASNQDGLDAVRAQSTHLVVLEADTTEDDSCRAISELKSLPVMRNLPLIVIAGEDPTDRARALDLGADDAVPRSCDPTELLARIRSQLRASREVRALVEKSRIAEQGQAIAHTAFEALAVTEKMTRDAFTLDRRLKVGLSALLGAVVLMAVVFLFFSRRAIRENERAYSAILRLERGVRRDEALIERSRKMREEIERTAADTLSRHKQQLEQHTQELQKEMSAAGTDNVERLRQELERTNSHLRRIETEGRIAQGIIRSFASSVCLLHVAVAFRHRQSGRNLRYAGINPQGEPIQDSDGNPIFDLEGRGPEVHADFFGTGFLGAAGSRILTNRHVVEPWWKSEELGSLTREGFDPVVGEMAAYFPGIEIPVRVSVLKVSPDSDLAVVSGELPGPRRAIPALDGRLEAAVSGQPVVLLGYATGLDAILARAGEESVRSIVAASNGEPRKILAELARRNLIRPLATQGHVGDVLADKIVYDAQTTSGGSGGPLFNQQGKVIGVNFAVVRGFGGSNFGIPIRFAQPLL